MPTLTSPGVQVTVTDQSQYLPAPTNSVPLVLFATASNKANPNATGVAVGTTAANAGKLFQVTSQRELTSLYGTPTFYTSNDGTPIQGYELNEYGLLAAYSALGVTNRVYCLRADIDLASLKAQTGRPTGNVDNGTYWLDTTNTEWGIYQWDATKQVFIEQMPIVITDSTNMVGNLPAGYLGTIGSYAVNAIPTYNQPTAAAEFFYKNSAGAWVALGSELWYASVPTLVGSKSPSSLNAGDTFNLTITGLSGVETSTATITVPGLGQNTVDGVVNAINNLGWHYLSASKNSSGRIQLFLSAGHSSTITLANGTGTALFQLGLPLTGTFHSPNFAYSTSARQPLWGTGQTTPRPTGSVWLKVGSSGMGFAPVMKVYDSTAKAWTTKNVVLAQSDAEAIASLDPTGGQAIPANTIYGQYNYDVQYEDGPVYFWKRIATGPTIVTGTQTSPAFNSGPYLLNVYITTPNNTNFTGPYVVTIPDDSNAEDFCAAWGTATLNGVPTGIPYTTATVSSTGAIVLTHTLGGAIRISDINAVTGKSNGALALAGFVPNTTTGVKYGYIVNTDFTNVAQSSTTGGGSGALFTIENGNLGYFTIACTFFGSGYAVGDEITFNGSLLGGDDGVNDLKVKVTSITGGGPTGGVGTITIADDSQPNDFKYEVMLSNFVKFDFTANEGAPTALPADKTNWFYSVTDQVDIMVNTTQGWKGYKNVAFSSTGFPLPSGSNNTDPNGPIISATVPTTESNGDPLQPGDLWVDTSDLEKYPVISRWQDVNGVMKWVLIDNTDQVSGSGILFADARWSSNQNTINPANDPIPTIKSLLTSNNLDLDAPNTFNYPVGMLLFNTRRSGYNVKQWRTNYFNNANFPDKTLPTIRSTWVSASGLQSSGAPFMGRKAQRAMVVQSLRATIDTNQNIRDEDNFFNLMATPNYPELQPNMVVLNADRGDTGYILGDTPMGLPENATAIQAWATNAANATSTGEDGCVTRNEYMGLFYPSGLALDLSGNEVAVPASHMMLRTFLRNDTVAYPWFAAAGTRRGVIDNATNIGYLDRTTGEFQVNKTRIGIRDVLYINMINPLVFFTGNGLLNYGNKSSKETNSALDRTNVSRLVAYIRRQLTIAARPFVFEPNDALTRQQITGVVQSLMVDLVAKRGLYDYLVICDESNNTPARIDRSELWIDVAVEPVKAAEFIYIPVRILNTGELKNK